MNSIVRRCLLAAVLFLAAAVSWAESRLAERVADERERLVTFQDDVDAPVGALPLLVARVTRTFHEQRLRHEPAGAYWRGRYGEVLRPRAGRDGATDRDVLLMTANATFRSNQPLRSSTDTGTLDVILQAYATVLRAGGFHEDAAYNYEYVARLRDRLARASTRSRPARAGAREETPPAAPVSTGADLPAGPTIHGRPGAHPVAPKGQEFEILTPMEYGEREAQPEQTPGRKLPRKG